jgi:hypothetical protein
MQKPSEMIRIHTAEAGNGFELDDLMSRWTGGIYDEITNRIVAIHGRYKTAEFRIGTSNPESFDELNELADELERRGH